MANIKLKTKKETGYETLYPQTLGKNVITSTGNVQNDIDKLIQEINDLDSKVDLEALSLKEETENTYVKNTQLATQTDSGIISFDEMQRRIRETEISYILGVEYGGAFGSNLTKIEADKVYFYWDSTKKTSIPYLARVTKTGVFITPDVENFKNMTIREDLFYKRLTVSIADSANIRLTIAYITNGLVKIFGYATDPVSLNALANGSPIVNLATMIPELKNYGTYGGIVAGANLIIGTDFTMSKSYSSIPFYYQHNFCIEIGVWKGTIR